MKRLIPLLLFLTGCGSYKNIDPNLRQYYNIFINEGLQREIDLNHIGVTVSFSYDLGKTKKNETILGLCSWDPLHDVAWVQIDLNDFKNLNDSQKEQLLFHEFGHCLLDWDHDDSLLPDGKPTSVMHSYLFSGTIYFDNRKYYVDELFLLD